MKRVAAVAAALVSLSVIGQAATYNGYRWFIPVIDMHFNLPGPGKLLSDGSTSWEAVLGAALSTWNPHMATSQFRAIFRSPAQIAQGNGINNVFAAATVYGTPFGGINESALATTRTVQIRDARGGAVEKDVIFNNAYVWDSYRGPIRPGVEDLRRVAIHEFGHVLGLGHPDAVGQRVDAIMNIHASDIDTLTADDIRGAQLLYGSPSPPTIPIISAISVLPNSGWGHTARFRLRYGSTNGITDLHIVQVAFAPSGQIEPDARNNCIVSYDRFQNRVFLVDDDGLNGPGVDPAGDDVVANSQCSVDMANTFVENDGGDLALHLSVTFARRYHGERNVLMYATGMGGQRTNGWQDRGDWNIGTVMVDSVAVAPTTPAYNPMVTVRASSVIGINDIGELWIQFGGPTPTRTFREHAAEFSCILKYTPRTNGLAVIDDLGSIFVGDGTPIGFPGVAGNQQCFVNLALVTAVRTANAVTLNIPMSFHRRWSGGRTIFTEAITGLRSSGIYSQGRVDVTSSGGPLLPPGDATADDVTPSTGSGETQVFALRYTSEYGGFDTGPTDLSVVWASFSATANDRINSCVMYYNVAERRLYLLDDTATSWRSGFLVRGFFNTSIENSQCIVHTSGGTAVVNGRTLTLNLPVTFKPAYAGRKNIFMFATASAGGFDGWKDAGDWTIAPTLSIGGATVMEGHAGQRQARFNVSLSGAVSSSVTVTYTVADQSATAASGDYVPISGTLTIPANTTSIPLFVTVNGDTVVEDSETFSVALSSPSGAVFRVPADAQATGMIANDDFTDPSLPGVIAKAVHITELRSLINVLRRANNLPDYPFSDTLTPGATMITATHVLQLRAALADVYPIAPVFSEALVPNVTPLKASHIQEIRDRAVAAPTSP